MTKTQRQRDKKIRQVLTAACETIKHSVSDFSYLTHSIDLNNESNTLKVSCYFSSDLAYQSAEPQFNELIHIITSKLASIGLAIKVKQICFLVD